MSNEEFQRLVLEKLSNLEHGQTEILSELKNLKQENQALLDLVEKIYHEVEKIASNQAVQLEMIKNLAADTAQHEAEISLLKRAK